MTVMKQQTDLSRANASGCIQPLAARGPAGLGPSSELPGRTFSDGQNFRGKGARPKTDEDSREQQHSSDYNFIPAARQRGPADLDVSSDFFRVRTHRPWSANDNHHHKHDNCCRVDLALWRADPDRNWNQLSHRSACAAFMDRRSGRPLPC